MVSLPGWGGPWERRERLGSDGSEISKKRYKLGHPRVQHTPMIRIPIEATYFYPRTLH